MSKIFGDGPYNFLPSTQFDLSPIYTTLFHSISTASAFSLGKPSAEYFIGVKSIKISDKAVPLNATLLSINGEGNKN